MLLYVMGLTLEHQPALAQLEEHVTVEVKPPVGVCWYHGVVGSNPTGRTFFSFCLFLWICCAVFADRSGFSGMDPFKCIYDSQVSRIIQLVNVCNSNSNSIMYFMFGIDDWC